VKIRIEHADPVAGIGQRSRDVYGGRRFSYTAFAADDGYFVINMSHGIANRSMVMLMFVMHL
jgi:hypothetical protein